MDEFVYIPPHEWERLKRLSSLLRPSHPEMSPSPELVSADPAKPTKVRSTKPVESTKQTAAATPLKPPPKRVTPLKRKPTQVMQRHGNTSHNSSGRSKWTALGHGFWYTPGPAVATPWHQWTWRDMVGQLARCVFVCCVVYGLLCLVW